MWSHNVDIEEEYAQERNDISLAREFDRLATMYQDITGQEYKGPNWDEVGTRPMLRIKQAIQKAAP